MADTAPTPSVEALQDLFYRCRFSMLLAELDAIETATEGLSAELTLLKANTLFELHRVADTREVLSQVARRSGGFDENYLYALARLTYVDSKARGLQEAKEIFEEIHARTANARHKFKSLLGLANTLYSAGEYGKLPAIISQLSAYEPIERDDERISLMIFLGNYYFASGTSNALAKQYLRKALAAAARNAWTYFIVRSLYFLAAVCEKDGQAAELMWTLEMLQAFVDESEQLLFAHIVNEKFKNSFSINVAMEFDTSNRRIMIKNRWIAFHDKPLLFHFLLLLHSRDGFVTKEEVAQGLWPDEGYKPRVHDPRIFDIAKRARQLIESYESQPVVLLSGRMGYKLAST